MSRSIPRTTSGLSGEASIRSSKTTTGRRLAIEAEPRPEAEETPLRPEAVIEGLPFRPAHGAQQDGVARRGHLHDGFGQGGAETVVGRAADEPLFHLEPDAGAFGHDVEDLLRLPHDLRPDPVAGENRDAIFFHFALPFRDVVHQPAVGDELLHEGRHRLDVERFGCAADDPDQPAVGVHLDLSALRSPAPTDRATRRWEAPC